MRTFGKIPANCAEPTGSAFLVLFKANILRLYHFFGGLIPSIHGLNDMVKTRYDFRAQVTESLD